MTLREHRRARARASLARVCTHRPDADISRFFEGLELLDPGVVQPHRWRPDSGDAIPSTPITAWSGVGRKA